MKKHLRIILAGSWGILALGYLFGILADASDPLLQVIAAIGFFGAVWMAVVLRSKHPWSTWFITVAGVIMTLMSPIVAVANGSVGALLFVLCVITFIFTWMKATRESLEPKIDFRTDAKQFGFMFTLVLFGSAILGFAIFETHNIQDSLKKMRFESQCNDPKVDIEACGQLGIVRTNSPSNEEELLAGRDLIATMCKNGNAVACRREVFLRLSWQIENLTYKNVADELWTHCQNDGGTACLALAVGEYSSPDEFMQVVKAKCSESDLDACIAWATAVPSDLNSGHARSCALGIGASCTHDSVPKAVREAACKKSNDPWTCFSTDATTPSADYCAQGVWAACDPSTWPERRWSQIGWWRRQGIKPAEPTEAWDGLEAGRGIIRKASELWRPKPMSLDQIDETFGASCDAGVVYGCLEGANAATNVQLKFRTKERIDHAVELLDKGCKLGNYLSCWLPLSLKKHSPEQALIKARNACYSAPRGIREYPEICRTYAHLWMAEAGVTPWVMDSTLGTPDMVNKCAEQKDQYVCLAVAEFTRFEMSTPIPNTMPELFVGREGAAISCSKNNTYGCEELVKMARMWPVKPEQSPEEVVKSICAKLPKMCKAAKAVYPLSL